MPEFMSTVAGQKYRSDIASIASSLRAIAKELVKANQEREASIAELRECLKEAIREKCPFTRMSCKHDEPCDYQCETQKWRKALEGANNEGK